MNERKVSRNRFKPPNVAFVGENSRPPGRVQRQLMISGSIAKRLLLAIFCLLWDLGFLGLMTRFTGVGCETSSIIVTYARRQARATLRTNPMRFDGRVMTASMTSYHRDCEYDVWPCEVRIDEERETIVVSYDEENTRLGIAIYRGKKVGCSSWELKCDDPQGVASLSLSPLDPKCLEGSWWEDGKSGMWQIDVDEGKEDDDVIDADPASR